LNRRKAIVYSHPTDAPCCHDLMPRFGALEWNTDTSRAIWSFIKEPPPDTASVSSATRQGRIKFIWSHAGGTLLGLVGRFLGDQANAQTVEANSRRYHLKRFYYDTSVSANLVQMQALKALVGSSQILLGSDFPFVTDIAKVISDLGRCGFDDNDLRGITGQNALSLLSRDR